MNDLTKKELHWKRGQHILDYIHQFSATEKAIFMVFCITILIASLIMAKAINDTFTVEVPAYGGTLREGLIGLPRNINPVLSITDIDRDISTLIYSGLMKYSDGVLVPDIAHSYTISDNGLVYTFTLQNRVDFQDGKPLTTEDIAFTIQKIQDPVLKSPRRLDWADVVVTVVSPSEIQFTLKQPYSPFLSNTTIGILPKHIWGIVPDDQFIFSQYNTNPIGSGPFEIHSIEYNSGGIPTKYRLKSWRKYYGQEPFISKITLSFFADENLALTALDQGSIDSIASLSPISASKLSIHSAQAYAIKSTPLPRVFGVFFNQNQSTVLAEKSVRQALEMVVDRTELIDTILKGYGSPIQGPLPLSNSLRDIDSDDISTRILSAQALLEKNGWRLDPDGIYNKKAPKSASTTLSFDIYTVNHPDLKQAAELIKNNWNKLGAHVEVKIYEQNDLYQNIIRTRKYDALLFGEFIGKDRDLYAFWHSSQRNAPGLNVAMYTNSKTDKLLEDIRTITDEKIRKTKYEELSKLIQDDIPAIFLYVPSFIYAIPKSFNNINLKSISTPSDRWNNIEDWYTETEHVWKIFNRKD